MTRVPNLWGIENQLITTQRKGVSTIGCAPIDTNYELDLVVLVRYSSGELVTIKMVFRLTSVPLFKKKKLSL